MTTTTHLERRPLRLPPRWRKAVLILHIISGVGWIGVDLALLPLAITGLTTDDGETAAASYRAIAVLVPWTIPTLSLLILMTGVTLGLGSKWGILRYWWVATKLVISLILTALVFVALLPAVTSLEVASGTTGNDVRAALEDPAVFLYPPVVSCTLLVIASILSVTKPWGRRKA
jgi:hypothetical protein